MRVLFVPASFRNMSKMTISKAAFRDMYGSMHDCLNVVLDHTASIPADLLAKEIAGFGHPTVLDQLAHVLAAEAAWVHRLQSLSFRQRDLGSLTGIDDIRRAKADVMTATISYVDSISELQFQNELEAYPDNWVGPRRSPAFILLHVITHAFHHKGQIVAMLRLSGYPAPDTDMQRE
jgi:uncharacterized damage-inducible protein DinB